RHRETRRVSPAVEVGEVFATVALRSATGAHPRVERVDLHTRHRLGFGRCEGVFDVAPGTFAVGDGEMFGQILWAAVLQQDIGDIRALEETVGERCGDLVVFGDDRRV